MVVDFQHHYTPPELMERGGAGILRLDENGNPNYKFNPLLADLPAHVRMMDRAGIDLAVLSCGSDCFTIVAGGLVPIARPSAAPTGCAWGSRSCRRHHKLSLRPTIPRPWKTTTRSLLISPRSAP